MDVDLSSQPSQAQHAVRGDRVARTREAIVASTLTLAMEGEVAPIVRDIAKLAGVSARTVFQHFADTAELYVAVLGRVLTNLANDSYHLGQLSDATTYLERALGVATDAESLLRMANAHMALGITARASGDFEAALKHCDRALAIHHLLGHEQIANHILTGAISGPPIDNSRWRLEAMVWWQQSQNRIRAGHMTQ